MNQEIITRHATELGTIIWETLDRQCDVIDEIAAFMAQALRDKKPILLFGNGGSAAQAQHLAAELVGRFMKERGPLPAIDLTSNGAVLTAIANDFEFEHVFSRQVNALGQPNGVAIGITTSGLSMNVLNGLHAANAVGMNTVALTGKLPVMEADHNIAVPSTCTPRIQEAHLFVSHVLCELIENEIIMEDSCR